MTCPVCRQPGKPHAKCAAEAEPDQLMALNKSDTRAMLALAKSYAPPPPKAQRQRPTEDLEKTQPATPAAKAGATLEAAQGKA